jgi:hypothetical protein
MSTIVVTVAIALVVALVVLAVAVAGTADGGTMVRDVRAARAARRAARRPREAGALAPAPAEVARPHVFAEAHRDLVDAADAEDGLDELLSWSQSEEGYLTAAELSERLRGAVHR